MIHLFLTQRCNLSCPYCDIPSLASPKDCSLETLEKFIPIINKFNDVVDIYGGETGLLSEEIVDRFFSLIKLPVNVATNGLFLERYYEKYKDKIASVEFHIAPTIENFKVFNGDKNITYVIVNDSKKTEEAFFTLQKKHRDLKFLLKPLFERIRGYDKISDFSDRNSFCSLFLHPSTIDMVNKKIQRCCKSYVLSDFIELNEESLVSLLKRERIFSDLNKRLCQGCPTPYKMTWKTFRK